MVLEKRKSYCCTKGKIGDGIFKRSEFIEYHWYSFEDDRMLKSVSGLKMF